MGLAENVNGIKHGGGITDDSGTVVVILDETAIEQQFDRKTLGRDDDALTITAQVGGLLSKNDIKVILHLFDTVANCLAILAPKSHSAAPPPTIFLLPVSPQLTSPITTPLSLQSILSNPLETADYDTDSPSPRSSTSHKKHPQSNSSDNQSCYGPEFLQLLRQSPCGTAHVVPVALCRKGEAWTKESLTRLLDMGIRDVLSLPCEPSNVGGLFMHLKDRFANPLEETVELHRYHKTRNAEPRHATFNSWIQNNTIIDLLVQTYTPQPNLLCRPVSTVDLLAPISPTHLSSLAEKVNDWDFHAGRLEEEELIWCAVLILEHVITTGTQDLIRFKISQDEILFFLLTVRSCYQPTNHYHNFRHAIDVLQATFQILVMSNIIPPLVTSNPPSPKVVPPLLPLSYLRPVEVLALCIAAIGHDAAHPGVTNAFLASSGSSLATVFNERSVLENFHCLTIGRIIQERWPALFADTDGVLRRMVLEMILSTDMALHFDFMARFEALKTSIIQDPIDDKQRRLICCCIMKSADISNLARPFDVSTDWTLFLQREIGAQNHLEQHLNLNITPAPPVNTTMDQTSQLAKSQLGFIDLFAEPLWRVGATVFFPGMKTGFLHIQENRQIWLRKLAPSTTESSTTSRTTTGTEKSVSSPSGSIIIPTSVPGSPKRCTSKFSSSVSLKENETKLRSERSFSSLRFWRKRNAKNSE